MSDTLKPCPFCHKPEPSDVGLSDEGGRYVVCVGCGTQGPYARTEVEAITGWNTRAAPDHDSIHRMAEAVHVNSSLCPGDRCPVFVRDICTALCHYFGLDQECHE